MEEKKKEKLKKRFQIGAGVAFIAVGVPGLVLPVLQGVLFIAVGLYLLALGSKRVDRWVERMCEKHPAVDRLRTKVHRTISLLKQHFPF